MAAALAIAGCWGHSGIRACAGVPSDDQFDGAYGLGIDFRVVSGAGRRKGYVADVPTSYFMWTYSILSMRFTSPMGDEEALARITSLAIQLHPALPVFVRGGLGPITSWGPSGQEHGYAGELSVGTMFPVGHQYLALEYGQFWARPADRSLDSSAANVMLYYSF
jgi:hypothetical protein